MFNMFKQLFTAITVFFGAAEKIAHAADHLATWGEETAASFADEARMERAAKRLKLQQKLATIEGEATVVAQ